MPVSVTALEKRPEYKACEAGMCLLPRQSPLVLYSISNLNYNET